MKLQKVSNSIIPESKKAREGDSQIHILELRESDLRMFWKKDRTMCPDTLKTSTAKQRWESLSSKF